MSDDTGGTGPIMRGVEGEHAATAADRAGHWYELECALSDGPIPFLGRSFNLRLLSLAQYAYALGQFMTCITLCGMGMDQVLARALTSVGHQDLMGVSFERRLEAAADCLSLSEEEMAAVRRLHALQVTYMPFLGRGLDHRGRLTGVAEDEV